MESYAEEAAFDYMNYRIQPPSVWDRLSWWFQDLWRQIFLNPNTPILTRIGYYIILIFVVGAAIFYIIKLRYGQALVTDYKSYTATGAALENQREEDFDLLIDEAIKKSDFKMAIRYVYLKSLMALAAKGMIQLKNFKSPYDYVSELNQGAGTYSKLARTFEYVWYGDFEANEKTFDQVKMLSNKLVREV